VDKSAAINACKLLNFISLRHFKYMSKKIVFIVVVKSRKKTAFFGVNNVTNVMFAIVTFKKT